MKTPSRLGLALTLSASFAMAQTDGETQAGNAPSPVETALTPGVKITYKPGGGITFSGGDDYSMKISGRVQVAWTYVDFDSTVPSSSDPSVSQPDLNSIDLRRARLKFQGHVWSEDVLYYIQIGPLRSRSLIDATIGYRFVDDESNSLRVRMGRGKVRSGLSADQSSTRLMFTERSGAASTFSGLRADGVLLEAQSFKTGEGGQLHWHLGAYNNDVAVGARANSVNSGFPSTDGPNESTALNYVAGLMWHLGGGGTSEQHGEGDLDHSGETYLIAGANVHFGNDRTDTGVKDEATTLNGYAAWKSGTGFSAQAEIFSRSDDVQGSGTADSLGWYAQLAYATAPGEGNQYGIAGRVSSVNLDQAGPMRMLTSIPLMNPATRPITQGSATEYALAGTIFHHKHALKSQLSYTYLDVQDDVGAADSTNHGVQAMFTLLF